MKYTLAREIGIVAKKMKEQLKHQKDSDSSAAAGYVRGLKDHEIQELVNVIRDATSPMIPHQCLRAVIERATTTYLSSKGLQIDKK